MARFALLLLGVACSPEILDLGGETDGGDCTGEDCDVPTIATPCIDIQPNLLQFGEVRLDVDDPVQTITISNPCAGQLEITELTFSQTLKGEPTEFELADAPKLPLEIGAAESYDLRIRPVPTRYSPFSDTLIIESNDQNFPEEFVAMTGQAVCISAEVDIDSDQDAIPDDCDICELGNDRFDSDGDGVPNACDRCDAFDDHVDVDRDTVPDGCDQCPGLDDTIDEDGDNIPDPCDACPLGDNTLDADGDTIADACDVCPGGNDLVDLDFDGVPDDCDVCQGFDDNVDTDTDTVADGCDQCPGFDDLLDADNDRVPDDCDICPDADDYLDADNDTVPDGCDLCPDGNDFDDADSDTVADHCDRCPGFDDLLDDDGDGRPNDCDDCPLGSNDLDADADGVADACDLCEGSPDGDDADNDSIPDGCDICPGGDDNTDSDTDTVPDYCDLCDGADDLADADNDTVPDGCDLCPAFDDAIDDDGDTIPDQCDVCPGFDDLEDRDGDLVPDDCDTCPDLADSIDDDLDGVPGGIDPNTGLPWPDSCDLCEGYDDTLDDDGDTIPDDCDACPGFDDLMDNDVDTVPDACDACPGFDDSHDDDFDDVPDDCDSCVGVPGFEVFPPAPANLADILVVVDDSCSMQPFQAALGNNFNAFIQAMGGVGADWQVAVITTTSPTFRGPVITNAPGAAKEFASQVNVGIGGSGFEQGILRAYEATQPGADAGPGSGTGFLRSNAVLSVVFVSDEPDQSGLVTPQQAYNYFVQLKGNDPGKVVVNGIVAPPPQDAGYNTIIQLAGGQQFDIVNAQWGESLASIAVGSLATQVYPIQNPPVPETILVRADGIPLEGWIFDQCQNAILFDGSNRPAAGSLVTVEYVQDCEGVPNGCNDGIDNDNDGLVDFPEEPGCETACDPNELDPPTAPVCANGLDDDSDGLVDYPNDPQCGGASYRYETCTEVDADVFGYRMCQDTGASTVCPDLSQGGQSLGLGDEGNVLVPLGFTFDFYGIDYTQVYVGSNGTLNFEVPRSPPNNLCVPAGSQNRTIMVWWDDLNPAGGAVYARTAGAAPNRRFEVQWKAPHINFNGNTLDVRAVLKEGSSDIELCYVDTLTGLGIDNGASATAAIQGNQAVYLEYSCFTGRLTQGKVVRFQHP